MARVTMTLLCALSVALVVQHTKVLQANKALRNRVAVLNNEDIPVGNKVFQLVGVGLDGKRVEHSLHSSRRPTLVFTLATGCPGCLDSLQAWMRLARQAADHGMDTIVVSRGSLASVRKFAEANQLPGIVIAEPTYETFVGLRLKVTPHAVLFAPGGTVAQVWKGAVDAGREAQIVVGLQSSNMGPTTGVQPGPGK
jgi:peroxiredoxin